MLQTRGQRPQLNTKGRNLISVAVVVLLYICSMPALKIAITPEMDPPDLFRKSDATQLVTAIKALSDAELQDLRQRQIEAFITAPMESTALDPLLLIDDVKENRTELARLTGIMAARSLRDVPVQMAAIQFAIVRGDFADLFRRYDALLRTQASSRFQLMRRCIRFCRRPQLRSNWPGSSQPIHHGAANF
jgi:hypothetical protein